MRSSLYAIAGLLAGASPAAATPACPPAAVVEGPAAIARPITSILRRHGIRSESSSCAGQTVKAVVSDRPDAKGYRLRIEDRFGRSNEREVSSAEMAASLIESWALDEDADLVAPRSTLVPPAVVTAEPAPAPPPPPIDSAGPQLMGTGELSATSDGSTWWGAGVLGCLSVHVLCVGGRARFAHTSGAFDAMVVGADLDRTAFGALAVVALPLRQGRFALMPAVGFGVEWTRAVATFGPLSASVNDYVLRTEGALIATVAIAGGWSVVGELGAMWGSSLSTETRQGTDVDFPRPPSTGFRGGLGLGFSR